MTHAATLPAPASVPASSARRRTASTALLAALLGATALASDARASTPIFDPIPEPIEFGPIHVAYETVATGLTSPLWGIDAPGQPDALYVVDQIGILWRIDLPSRRVSQFLDLSDRLVPLGLGGRGTYDERGFLGMAFHPDYATNGLLYTYTSEPADQPADFTTLGPGQFADHQDVVTEWHVPNPSDPASLPDPRSARTLFRGDHPQFNNNGGTLQFGPEGLLYLSIGDGGDVDDESVGHLPGGNAQSVETVLGKVLRIDPLGNDSANGQYGIPADNPFAGATPGLDEIFAYGFRNPYRMSFEARGDYQLSLCDVGQSEIEEFNIVKLGENHGWREKAGTFLFDINGVDLGFVYVDSPGIPIGLVDPVAQYDHNEGLAVIGGFVYEGARMPALAGSFVFGDHQPFAGDVGRLFHVPKSGGTIHEITIVSDRKEFAYLLGFGRDAHGEVYVMGNTTEAPFKTTGFVRRIASMPGDVNSDGVVNGADLGLVLGSWESADPAADLNHDGVVNGADLGVLLGAWTG